VLVYLTTSGCHLCEEAKSLLLQASDGEGLIFTEVDIASDDALVERYGLRIPVLCRGQRELDWPFALADIQALIKD